MPSLLVTAIITGDCHNIHLDMHAFHCIKPTEC